VDRAEQQGAAWTGIAAWTRRWARAAAAPAGPCGSLARMQVLTSLKLQGERELRQGGVVVRLGAVQPAQATSCTFAGLLPREVSRSYKRHRWRGFGVLLLNRVANFYLELPFYSWKSGIKVRSWERRLQISKNKHQTMAGGQQI
jgi:hypothetical protein